MKPGQEYNKEKVEGEQHSRPTLLSGFILGSQDGLVNVLGIILGMSAATQNIKLIFVAILAALGAESVSMGAVAYTSTASRRRLYLRETERARYGFVSRLSSIALTSTLGDSALSRKLV